MLYIAAAATPANVADSDAVCAALQVLEHCQDVGEDARAGRVYLPAEDLAAAGVGDADLLAPTTSPGLRRAVAVQVGRCDELLGAGRDLIAAAVRVAARRRQRLPGRRARHRRRAARRPLPTCSSGPSARTGCAPSRTQPA